MEAFNAQASSASLATMVRSRVLLSSAIVGATIAASFGLGGTASAVATGGTGCVEYVNFVWEADRNTTISDYGTFSTSAAQTYGENQDDPPCGYPRYNINIEVSLIQYVYVNGAYQICAVDYHSAVGEVGAAGTCGSSPISDLVHSGHRAWFAGNPWDSSAAVAI
jgi:hypothetical protein